MLIFWVILDHIFMRKEKELIFLLKFFLWNLWKINKIKSFIAIIIFDYLNFRNKWEGEKEEKTSWRELFTTTRYKINFSRINRIARSSSFKNEKKGRENRKNINESKKVLQYNTKIHKYGNMKIRKIRTKIQK